MELLRRNEKMNIEEMKETLSELLSNYCYKVCDYNKCNDCIYTHTIDEFKYLIDNMRDFVNKFNYE